MRLKQILNLFFRSKPEFESSSKYWEDRYKQGDNSGGGSYGALSKFKAQVINEIVKKQGIESVIEYGCGDGAQLELAKYKDYLGFDVASKAIELCRQKHANDFTKRFKLLSDYSDETSECVLSLDVIYHLVEQEVFENHLRLLFTTATKLVIIYSSDFDSASAPHVRHRAFTPWIKRNIKDWVLFEKVPNDFPFNRETKSGSHADFFIYTKKSQ